MNNFNDKISALEKRYSNMERLETSKLIPTGIIELDTILDGGFPRGNIIEIFGDHSVGKTTLAWNVIKQAQEQELISLYFDCDYSWNSKYAEQIGIDVDKSDIVIAKPNEQWIQAITHLINKGLIDVLVIDTISSLAIGKERLLNILKRLSRKIKENNILVILLNQVRTNFNHDTVVMYEELMKLYGTIRIYLTHKAYKTKHFNNIQKIIQAEIVQNKLDNCKSATFTIGVQHD